LIVYRFGDWLVEPGLSRIRRDKECRHLEPKALDVLNCLLSQPGEVISQETLLRTVWRDRVVETSAIPRNIALLRRALGDSSRQPRYIETIPKLGYRTVASVTPEQPQAFARETNQFNLGSSVTLAVLPFDNLSSDSELAYFSEGVSEEILQTVARTTGIKVIGRSSSFLFQDSAKAVRHVAAELGCTHVLDGAVRRSGDRTRISAQLIECDGQTTIWADRFQFDLQDVFVVQDAVAAAVARALRVAFNEPVAAGTIDPIAFDLYLQAKAASTQWLGACDAGLLEQAIARAPTFAQAWATLAVTRAIESHVEQDPARSAPLRAKAMEAANNALRLEPSSGSAYAALSIIEPICGRFEERDTLIANALRISPNDPVALFWACRWSWAVGRLREGLSYITRACQIDPLWSQGLHQYASMLWLVGLDTEADKVWDDLISRWPDRDYLYAVPLSLNAYLGNWQRVDDLSARLAASGLETDRSAWVRETVEKFRRWDDRETQKLFQELTEEVERSGTMQLYLQLPCHLGLTEQVYGLLERASFAHLFDPGGRVHELDFGLHALFNRRGDAMRGDPRFMRLCARLGLCDYWVRTGRWPDCADELSRYYDFRREAERYVSGNGAGVPTQA